VKFATVPVADVMRTLNGKLPFAAPQLVPLTTPALDKVYPGGRLPAVIRNV
jgi:hypothetical protein